MVTEVNIDNARKEFDTLGALYEKSESVTIDYEAIENVNCYWFNPKGKGVSNSNRLVIYLHGGCFVLGSIQSHRSMVSHLSDYLSLPILFIEYSLAPEDPFPVALNEIEKVYKKILLLHPQRDLILIGDSAGAGLAISLLSKVTMENIKPPMYLVMLSPWVDLTCSNDTLLENKDRDPILTKEALQDYASMYVAGNKLSSANPIENMNGIYPPTLILVGSGEILLGDGKSIHRKIEKHQGKTKLSVYDRQNHVWMLADIRAEASQKALIEIKKFISH